MSNELTSVSRDYLEYYMTFPFIALLLAIAFMPFLNKEWWEAHFRKVALVLACSVIGYYFFLLQDKVRLIALIHEYVTFIVLIGSLFVVTGGISLRVPENASPIRNTFFLLGGALLSSFIGTTGASMLLIRPWIRSNGGRIRAYHIVFFILMVSNIGGGLSPIGDPPLFLGYLRGVPFFWVIEHLWSPWLLAVSLLAGMFYIWDKINFLKISSWRSEKAMMKGSFSFEGKFNLFFLFLILVAFFLKSPWRESVMVVAAITSFTVTPKRIFKTNKFTFHPMEEVAWLFFGIFATMLPVLDYLEKQKDVLATSFHLNPLHFYYLTGVLSAFLDNAPTYLTFLQLHLGLEGKSIDSMSDVVFAANHHVSAIRAISLGAVFFGGMTYIGNGPNFMVKSIAEEAGIKMPLFFKYIFCYSLPLLLPVLVLVGWLYCR